MSGAQCGRAVALAGDGRSLGSDAGKFPSSKIAREMRFFPRWAPVRPKPGTESPEAAARGAFVPVVLLDNLRRFTTVVVLAGSGGEAMAQKKKSTIHDTEWDLLGVLWSKERATAREVTEALEKKRGWAVSTVKTLLDRMVQKKLVAARQVGNVWEYTPAVRTVEARRSAWAELLDKAFGGSVVPALHFLTQEAKLSKRELAELRALIEAKEEKDGNG